MKIGLITIIDNINIGSILQAFALCLKIKELGHEVILIDYCRCNQTLKGTVKAEIYKKNRNFVKKLVFILGKILINNRIKKNLRKPLIRNFKLTKRFESIDDITKNLPIADVYMTGSDQVWNTHYNEGIDRAFFLDFTDKPKISYACSMGEDEFPSKYLKEIKYLLSQYRNISLRESLSARYINSLGFCNAYSDIDPTLLLTRDEWLNQFKEEFEIPKEPYLFVYTVEGKNNNFIFKQAEIIASEMNLKLVAFTTYPAIMRKKYNTDKIYSFADTRKFVYLISNASFVVASSFHGTAFSINFNKQFITIAPEKFNIRIMSLLSDLNLKDRIVEKKMISIHDLNKIDYNKVNKTLSSMREESLLNLRHSIDSLCQN